MLDRRSFFKISAAAVGAAYGLPKAARARTLDRIGLQLYTVRSLMEWDFAGTLKEVADAGYAEVEFAGYFGNEPQKVRDIVAELGLDPVAAHLPREAFESNLDETLAMAKVIGHRYLVLPWLDPAERTPAGYAGLAALCNEAGKACQSAGLTFGYHNHEFEFDSLEAADGGKKGFDILLEETDPDLVTFEMDLFWIEKGGADPLAYFDRYPGRFALCHVKDMDPDGNMVDVGDGVIDFAPIFASSAKAGLRHYIVEHDQPADALFSIRTSHDNLAVVEF
jgi:sugar phosphate isomerase/epimerase